MMSSDAERSAALPVCSIALDRNDREPQDSVGLTEYDTSNEDVWQTPFPRETVCRRRNRWIGQEHSGRASAEMARVRRLRHLLQRMELLAPGSRGNASWKKETDADSHDVQPHPRDGLCRPDGTPHHSAT